jgi:hypothetical protein
MPQLGTNHFAAHVHRVIDLDERGAAPKAFEGFMDSIDVRADEDSALRMLAASLRNAPVGPGGTCRAGRRRRGRPHRAGAVRLRTSLR